MPLGAPLAGRLTPDGAIRGRRLPLAPSPLQVWAVEDTSVQLTWGALPAGTVTADAGTSGTTVEHRGGPGGLVVDGLRPDSVHRIRVSWDGGSQVLAARTLAPPPGALLARVATLSDLHLGATRFGFLRTMGEHGHHHAPHPERCAAAALAEAAAWGADLVVLKGDVVEDRHPEHFTLAADLLDRFCHVPVMLLPGNHDVNDETDMDLPAALGARGVRYVDDVAHLDLPGLRVVGANTTIPGQGVGSLAGVGDAVIDRAATAAAGVLLLTHQQLQRFRFPTHWPPGISAAEGRPFLDRLAAANPRTVVSSGHSHRNRARRHGPVLVTEVGSTKDWPGVWAGYAVHEGGIRQVVRRCQAPEAMAWTEYSRAAVLGLWGRWSPGRLTERCLVHHWPTARRSG